MRHNGAQKLDFLETRVLPCYFFAAHGRIVAELSDTLLGLVINGRTPHDGNTFRDLLATGVRSIVDELIFESPKI